MQPYIAKLLQRQDLTVEEAEVAMHTIMSGEATPAQIGGYLIGLRMKGETVDEIAGSATPPARAATARTRSTSPPPPRL